MYFSSSSWNAKNAFSPQGSNYVEIDVNIHNFCYLARKGANSLFGDLHKFVIDLGLVVEGRDDDELPEQILGCAQLGYCKWANALSFREALGRFGLPGKPIPK